MLEGLKIKERAYGSRWLARFDRQALTREDSRSRNVLSLCGSCVPNSDDAASLYVRWFLDAKLGGNRDYRWSVLDNLKASDQAENKMTARNVRTEAPRFG